MPRPRFTVRQVMLAVLAVAALLAAFEAGRRWEREHTPRVRYAVYQKALSRASAARNAVKPPRATDPSPAQPAAR